MKDQAQRYAYRERAHTPGEPVRPVELVKEGPPRSQKARVRWLDGAYKGLEEWVPKVRLVVPWEEAGAFVEDERRMLEALDATDDVYDTVPHKAVGMVFSALPRGDEDYIVYFGIKAIERELLYIEDLDYAVERLGLSRERLLGVPHSFTDRFGEYRAPFGAAIGVARQCCENFSHEVLRYVQAEEDALREAVLSGYYKFPNRRHVSSSRDKDGFEILRERAEEWLAEEAPVFNQVRDWCGEEAAGEFDQVLKLREEVDRLRELVGDTARWLRHSGHPVKAGLLLRDLENTSEDIKTP